MDFKKLFSRKNRKISRPKRPEYQDKDVQPRLPKTRERALTLHDPGQLASGLLSRLPIELRLRIYDDVLGHRKVHVAFEFRPREYRTGMKKEHLEWRWWHCICTWDQTEDDGHRSFWWDGCRRGRTQGGNQNERGPPNGMMGKLKLDFAILLTCRQVYSEAIDILYSTTTFDFGTRQLLCNFPSLVLPQRFALISAIEMQWEFVNLGASVITAKHRQLYHDMWAMLAGMPNLRHLKIAVGAQECPNPAPADLKEVWLGPLKQLGKMDVFEVLVPSSYARHLSDEGSDFIPSSYERQLTVDEGSNFTLRTSKDNTTAMACFGSSANA
ncbi:hypothetical protein VE02_06534 [Pseudogymnoascus sp. 03VT05]|nr:hypothetical protein VE02_06534 [Pseudogymnoascus sp. 03VT05]